MFPCELYKISKNTFSASDCFSKYESLYMIATIHSCLIKSCPENLENIQEHICIGFQLLSYKFRKIKDWLNPNND